MSKKRIIACLDIKDGRVVKGVNFEDLKDAGDPIEIAQKYSKLGADEIAFLNIASTIEGKKRMQEIVSEVTKTVSTPIVVGGGIDSVSDIDKLLGLGVSKVTIGSASIKRPQIITESAKAFGSSCIIVAIDTKYDKDIHKVHIGGGKIRTDVDTIMWAKKCQELGAGEILLTSMDRDGTKAGYDLEITKLVANAVEIPVIASGGAGVKEHFLDVLSAEIGADAALAASLFHFNEISIPQLKNYLLMHNIEVNIKEID